MVKASAQKEKTTTQNVEKKTPTKEVSTTEQKKSVFD